MNPNIEVKWIYPYKENGYQDLDAEKIPLYVTKSTEDLEMSSLGFNNVEEAELAVSIAKAMKFHGIYNPSELAKHLKYTVRVIGLVNSEWFK